MRGRLHLSDQISLRYAEKDQACIDEWVPEVWVHMTMIHGPPPETIGMPKQPSAVRRYKVLDMHDVGMR